MKHCLVSILVFFNSFLLFAQDLDSWVDLGKINVEFYEVIVAKDQSIPVLLLTRKDKMSIGKPPEVLLMIPAPLGNLKPSETGDLPVILVKGKPESVNFILKDPDPTSLMYIINTARMIIENNGLGTTEFIVRIKFVDNKTLQEVKCKVLLLKDFPEWIRRQYVSLLSKVWFNDEPPGVQL